MINKNSIEQNDICKAVDALWELRGMNENVDPAWKFLKEFVAREIRSSDNDDWLITLLFALRGKYDLP